MRTMIEALSAEFVRYKHLGDKTFTQLGPHELSAPPPGGGNSIATICWHVSGNLRSRFTDFLTTDGEKPWRQRDEEFEVRDVTKDALLEKWGEGWTVLIGALDELADEHLDVTVTIRGVPLTVREALLRSLAHVSYHVGQIVYAGKMIRGASWTCLSIPPGGSAQYNQNPTLERPEATK